MIDAGEMASAIASLSAESPKSVPSPDFDPGVAATYQVRWESINRAMADLAVRHLPLLGRERPAARRADHGDHFGSPAAGGAAFSVLKRFRR